MNKLLLILVLLSLTYSVFTLDIETKTIGNTTAIYVLIPFDSFFFQAKNGLANYVLSINLSNDKKQNIIQTNYELKLSKDDVKSGSAYLHEIDFKSEPGKYKLTAILRNLDLGDKKERQFEIITVATPEIYKSILVANNGKFNFMPSAYTQIDSMLQSCYLVMNSTSYQDSVLLQYDSVSQSKKIRIYVTENNQYDLLPLLKSGNLDNLKLVYFSDNVMKTVQVPLFGKSNNYEQIYSLEEQLQQIRYIASQNEWNTLKKVKEKDFAEAIEYFWEKHNSNPGTQANETRVMFYDRVLKADKLFTVHKKLRGWKSDRGRIYIQYGPPDDIVEDWYYLDDLIHSRTFPLIRWYYYRAHKVFNFVDKTGYGNFQIVDEFYEN